VAIYGPRRILLSPPPSLRSLPFSCRFQLILGQVALEVLPAWPPGLFIPCHDLRSYFAPKRLIIFGIRGLRRGHYFHEQRGSGAAWLVCRPSFLALDFLARRLGDAPDDACVYFGVPRRNPGTCLLQLARIAYFSLSLGLLYGALDQGERLDWFHSPVIIAMTAAGLFLLAAPLVSEGAGAESAVDLSFVNSRNLVILALSIFVFKFVHLASIILIPGFLATSKISTVETGHALAWIALPPICRGVAGSCRYSLHQLAAHPGRESNHSGR